MSNDGNITVTLRQLGQKDKDMSLPEGATPKDLFDKIDGGDGVSLRYQGQNLTPQSPGNLQDGQHIMLIGNLKNG